MYIEDIAFFLGIVIKALALYLHNYWFVEVVELMPGQGSNLIKEATHCISNRIIELAKSDYFAMD